MKIKQEVYDIFYKDEIGDEHTGKLGLKTLSKPYMKKGCVKGIKKYHISRKGTARENPRLKFLLSQPFKIVRKTAEFEIEVERLGGAS